PEAAAAGVADRRDVSLGEDDVGWVKIPVEPRLGSAPVGQAQAVLPEAEDGPRIGHDTVEPRDGRADVVVAAPERDSPIVAGRSWALDGPQGGEKVGDRPPRFVKLERWRDGGRVAREPRHDAPAPRVPFAGLAGPDRNWDR